LFPAFPGHPEAIALKTLKLSNPMGPRRLQPHKNADGLQQTGLTLRIFPQKDRDFPRNFQVQCLKTAKVNKTEGLDHHPLFPVHDPSSIRIIHFALEISPSRINFAQTERMAALPKSAAGD
tara:strand:- start:3332 stop:3694 length:363 start_codon:yes stop_codon:yes gene_type:complete